MRKLQIFIFIELLLFALAMVTILGTDFSRFILLLVLFLLSLYYYFGRQKGNFLLVVSSLLLFFTMMLNPFVIAGVVLAFVYFFLEGIASIRRENQATHLKFEEDLDLKREKNPWFGDLHHLNQDSCQFDDINLVRIGGKDTIHLEEVILNHHDNVVVLHKGFGDTQIIVPVDVSVSLKVNSLYGNVKFFDEVDYLLRNESLSIVSRDFKRNSKSVKIIISSGVGNIEVTRK